MDEVEEVGEVERLCFTNPWPLNAYRRELRNASQNYYVVLRDDPGADEGPGRGDLDPVDPLAPRSQLRRPHRFAFWALGRRSTNQAIPPIIGFAGMWNLYDEAHVTTIGITPGYRGQGLGELLFIALMDAAIQRKVTWVTLEVRVSNESAQALYRKYGFTVQGRRPRYYSDNNEDAYIMWSESLRNGDYLDRLNRLRRKLAHRMSFEPST